jgi:8-amino-7-oxononanoate synthase
MNKYYFFEDELNRLRDNDSFRVLRPLSDRDGKYTSWNGKIYLNLSSNDYLGLATDKELVRKFYAGLNDNNLIENFGPGSSSSRLLTGNSGLYDELENELASLYRKYDSSKTALVFNSGYHANIGIIPALVSKGDLILSDKLNHASIIDGIKLSGAEFLRYRHMDYEHLTSLLNLKRNSYKKVLIITESVFSMDGDIADLKKLTEIKNRYDALLYVDEAHAAGVFGRNGLGVCERENVINNIDFILGTFGKAFGSHGSYIITDQILKDYLINKMRPFIFTTGLPPVVINWILFIVKLLPDLNDKRTRLIETSKMLREKLIEYGLSTCGESQIIPVMIGGNKKTVEISELLQDMGYLIFPIRPPTVPENTSRLRISLNSEITWNDLEKLPGIIKEKLQ